MTNVLKVTVKRIRMMKAEISRMAKILFTVFLYACCAALLFYSVREVARFPKWIVDDAFISFRYADNLVVNGELNWNPGDDPTEGYTCVAMVWLISVAMKLGVSPVMAAHILGIFFYYLGAAVLVLAFRGIRLASVAALALYLTAPFFYTHAWSGLETTMFTALIVLAIYGYSARHRRLFAFAILLLSLTRPEGILLSVILLSFFRPFSWSVVLSYAIPFSVYYIWRWSYYGQFFPNTFYAKFATESDENTLLRLREFFMTYLLLPGILAFVLALRENIRENRRLITGLAVFTAACLGVYLSSHLVMNYAYRFFVPFYPLVLLALAGVLYKARFDAMTLILTVSLMTPQLRKNLDRHILKDLTVFSRTYQGIIEDEHVRIGTFLKEKIDPDEWLVVHADAGAIPYYSRLRTLDFGRLNNEYLARNDPTPKEIVDYLYSYNPGVMVFTSFDKQIVRHGPEADKIIRDRRFNNYRLAKIYSSRSKSNYLEFVYLRNDIADSLGFFAVDDTEQPAIARTRSGAREIGKSAAASLLDNNGNFTRGREKPRDRSPSDDLGAPDGLWNYAQGKEDRMMRRIAFEKFIGLYGDDSRAPEALWELSAIIEAPAERIEKLRMLYEKYPENELAPKALFTIGLIYSEEIKDIQKAGECFRELIGKYPGTDAAETAKWMIENSESETPVLE